MSQQSTITEYHLQRGACVYVRQATWPPSASALAQYALRERAVALGWPPERVVVIDGDLGHSGATTHGRPGFRRLVSEIARGRVGLVLALDVSRFTRTLADWRRLVALCARTETLIGLDEATYDAHELLALIAVAPERRA